MKLKDGEARHLAALLAAVARPRSEPEAIEVQTWIVRLSGGR